MGAARWHDVWAQVAKQHQLAMHSVELEMRGEIAECSVRIFLDETGTSALAASIEWPAPLGIALLIRMKQLLDFGLAFDDDKFSEEVPRLGLGELLEAKAIFDQALRSGLLAFDEVGGDDKAAEVRSRSPGHDQPWIGEFVGKVIVLAETMARAARRVPPPSAMGSYVAAWREFAATVAGRFDVGAMRIADATFEGAPLLIETVFLDDRPSGAKAALDSRRAAPVEKRIDPDSEEALRSAPPGVRELVNVIKDGGVSLSIEAESMTLLTSEPLPDPAVLRDRLSAMLASAARLREGESDRA